MRNLNLNRRRSIMEQRNERLARRARIEKILESRENSSLIYEGKYLTILNIYGFDAYKNLLEKYTNIQVKFFNTHHEWEEADKILRKAFRNMNDDGTYGLINRLFSDYMDCIKSVLDKYTKILKISNDEEESENFFADELKKSYSDVNKLKKSVDEIESQLKYFKNNLN